MKRLAVLLLVMVTGTSYAADDSLFGLLGKAVNKMTPKTWKYTENKDDFSGITTYSAEIRPTNQVKLASPYSDHDTELLFNIISVSGHDSSVMLLTTNGLLACNMTSCDFMVKIGDQAPMRLHARPVGTRHDALSVDGTDAVALIDKVKSAQKMTIRIEYFRDGNQDFNYTPVGLALPEAKSTEAPVIDVPAKPEEAPAS